MRITGGIHRSRMLRAPRGAATRPTSDRVREALFGILAAAGSIDGANVLDLYAGTGALALEALSRGAARALLVDSSREALAALRANVEALGEGRRADAWAGDVERLAARIGGRGPFDLIFADPPWARVDDAARVLAAILGAGAAHPATRIVLEHSSRTAPPAIAGAASIESRRYGDATLTFYKPAILGAPRNDVYAGSPSD